MNIFVLLIFIFSYILFVIFPSKRTIVAVFSAIVLTFLCIRGYHQSPLYGIDFNVINIFIGTLLVSNLIVESGIAEYIAEKIIHRVKSIKWILLSLCVVTGFLSMFLENVATLIIVAPVAFQIANKLRINPAKLIFALAVSSNLQGTATLIGDPPSILLAGATGMNFLDFFIYRGRPSIFFAVELAAISSFFILYLMFSIDRQQPEEIIFQAKVKSWLPLYILCLKILALVLASVFLPHGEGSPFLKTAGFICLFCGVLSLMVKKFVLKTSIRQGIKELDWETALFLAGVFVLVKSIEIAGLIDTFGKILLDVVGKDKFLIYTLFVVAAVLVSGFVDNVPFFMTMIPVAKVVSHQAFVPVELLLFGLLIGTTLGGNITPTGAQANIVAWGMLKKQGNDATFIDFVKIGLPFTIAAVMPSYIFVWLIWR